MHIQIGYQEIRPKNSKTNLWRSARKVIMQKKSSTAPFSKSKEDGWRASRQAYRNKVIYEATEF